MIREGRRAGSAVTRWAVPAVLAAVVVAGIALVLALDLRNPVSLPRGLVVPTAQTPTPTPTRHHHHRAGSHHPTPSSQPSTPVSAPISGVVTPNRPIVSESPDRNERGDGTGDNGSQRSGSRGDE